MSSVDALLEVLTPDIYRRFLTAIELRKWPNGQGLTPGQLQTCMRAVIAYEAKHLPEEQRTGYMPPKKQACAPDVPEAETEQPLTWD